MPAIQGRLTRLERELGDDDGPCRCGRMPGRWCRVVADDDLRVVWVGRKPVVLRELCPTCRRVRVVSEIHVSRECYDAL